VTLASTVVGDELRPGYVAAVTVRNMTLLRSAASYVWLVLSGFAEALLYLFAIGWGVGALVDEIALPDGRIVPYLDAVAPALLAASAMRGALAESTINFFAKLRYLKHYDSVLNTPVTPAEITFGELGWATVRGAMYSAMFLALMGVMGLTTPLRALASLPAAVLVGVAFGGLGLALSTYMRDWGDFEYSGVVEFAMFVFSGTFVPVSSYPLAGQVAVWLSPLYHGIELIRGITLGDVTAGIVIHVAYLVVVSVVTMALASRRMRVRLQS
jgi:lipooligosaccharide transport system permease protein